MIAETQSLLAEVDAALAATSSAQRSSMLRRLADLFIDGAETFHDDHVAVFDGVIGRVIEKSERQALVELSKKLAPVRNAPTNVVVRLSRDNDIAVSGPVIENSVALADGPLAEIASTKSQKHLAAIAARRAVSETVTDALVARAEPEVARKVIANPGARFSDLGFVKLINQAKSDKALATAIAARPDVPQELQPFLRLALAS